MANHVSSRLFSAVIGSCIILVHSSTTLFAAEAQRYFGAIQVSAQLNISNKVPLPLRCKASIQAPSDQSVSVDAHLDISDGTGTCDLTLNYDWQSTSSFAFVILTVSTELPYGVIGGKSVISDWTQSAGLSQDGTTQVKSFGTLNVQ
jgi:hypothetical protein